MSKAASWLLSFGILLFVAVLVSHDFSAIITTLAHAGLGLLIVALFHLLPLVIDALAIRILFEHGSSPDRRTAAHGAFPRAARIAEG
jgi:hypothetical protein